MIRMLISAGADGIFQMDITYGGRLSSFNDDVVLTNDGRSFFRQWGFK